MNLNPEGPSSKTICPCVRPPVIPSVYKRLLSLCRKLLQFRYYCFENLYKHWSYTEVVHDVIFKCQVNLL